MIEKPSIPAVSRKPVPLPTDIVAQHQASQPGASSRAMPILWTPDVMALAKAHARDVFPEEASGIVTRDGVYQRLTNRSKTPTEEVGVSDEDMVKLAEAAMYFHSHPNGPACPSMADMRLQMQLEIPFAIYSVDTNDLFAWGDSLHKPPLIGRAFRHGISDCYSLVRDWFLQEKGVTLIDRPREWDWWLNGTDNFYDDGFKEAGFIKIPKEEATQKGDALLFQFKYKVIMHAAIVVDKDLLLHHISGQYPYDPSRISGTVPRLRWVRHAVTGMRYVGGQTDGA